MRRKKTDLPVRKPVGAFLSWHEYDMSLFPYFGIAFKVEELDAFIRVNPRQTTKSRMWLIWETMVEILIDKLKCKQSEAMMKAKEALTLFYQACVECPKKHEGLSPFVAKIDKLEKTE